MFIHYTLTYSIHYHTFCQSRQIRYPLKISLPFLLFFIIYVFGYSTILQRLSNGCRWSASIPERRPYGRLQNCLQRWVYVSNFALYVKCLSLHFALCFNVHKLIIIMYIEIVWKCTKPDRTDCSWRHVPCLPRRLPFSAKAALRGTLVYDFPNSDPSPL